MVGAAAKNAASANAIARTGTTNWHLELVALLLAIICVASMEAYIGHVLVPYQQREHQRLGISGNLSDLYPPWRATKELLDSGRDPYSPEVAAEIQAGFYGRALHGGAAEPSDQQRFAYPVIVCLFLSPLRFFDFETARIFAEVALVILTVASVLLWIRLIPQCGSVLASAAAVVFVLGSWACAQAFHLQQIGLLAAFFATAAVASVASRRLLMAGMFAGLAMFKPQLSVPLLAWLLLWSFAVWNRRWKFVAGFSLTLLAMLAISEMLLPGWVAEWLHAIRDYRQYTNADPLPVVLFGHAGGTLLGIAVIAATSWMLWRIRRCHARSSTFLAGAALALATGLFVSPNWASHNQVVLIGPALLLWFDRGTLLRRRTLPGNAAFGVVVASTVWPWMISIVIIALEPFIPQLRVWAVRWPLYSVVVTPVAFAGAMALYMKRLLENAGEHEPAAD